ncbi:MAG: MMPL family transporter [Candidatus Nanohaloarchaea archaeon]|nr:MMPL family transporter [Candidatus Nanohaloarchaea archaeon]
MIEPLARQLVRLQTAKPFHVLAALGLVTALLVPGILQLQIRPSTEAILPEDDPVVESLDTLRAKFSGDSTYILVRDSHDIRRHDFMEKLQRIENRLIRLENVAGVTSPASILEQQYGRIPEQKERLSIDYRGLATDDYRTAVITVRADTQADASEIRQLHNQITRIMQAEALGEGFQLTGYNMINLATFQVIISDFIKITAVAFLAVLTVLYAVFRDVKRMLMPVTPVILALIWMLGLGGYLGADLTIISMVSAAMIMGLGIDFGIHVTKRYYGSTRDREGLETTMEELARGLLGGSTTTGVGFLALLAANLAGMHALGIFLFTGIMSAYMGAVILLPTIIVLIDL